MRPKKAGSLLVSVAMLHPPCCLNLLLEAPCVPCTAFPIKLVYLDLGCPNRTKTVNCIALKSDTAGQYAYYSKILISHFLSCHKTRTDSEQIMFIQNDNRFVCKSGCIGIKYYPSTKKKNIYIHSYLMRSVYFLFDHLSFFIEHHIANAFKGEKRRLSSVNQYLFEAYN